MIPFILETPRQRSCRPASPSRSSPFPCSTYRAAASPGTSWATRQHRSSWPSRKPSWGSTSPSFTRYFSWLTGRAGRDLGASWFTSEPVANALATRIPVTMTMVVVAMILISIIATLIGVAAAVKRGWVDRVVQIGAIIGDSIPGFVIGIILVTILAIQMGLFPATSTISPGVPCRCLGAVPDPSGDRPADQRCHRRRAADPQRRHQAARTRLRPHPPQPRHR